VFELHGKTSLSPAGRTLPIDRMPGARPQCLRVLSVGRSVILNRTGIQGRRVIRPQRTCMALVTPVSIFAGADGDIGFPSAGSDRSPLRRCVPDPFSRAHRSCQPRRPASDWVISPNPALNLPGAPLKTKPRSLAHGVHATLIPRRTLCFDSIS
jgi:hypothetical protein